MEVLLLTFWVIYLFMIGAAFASFFNVVGIRALNNVSLNRRSQCPNCNNTLRWVDIIPIFGYLINRGKCHFCQKKIHIKYLLIELFGGASFVLAFWINGFVKLNLNYDFSSERLISLIMCLLLLSLTMMVVVSYYEHKIILTKITYVFAPILVVLSVFGGDFKNAMLGMAICVICSLLVSYLDKRVFKYVLYTASMGVVLGLFGTLVMIALALLLVLIVKIVKKTPEFIYYVSVVCVISLFTSPFLYTIFTNLIR